MFLPKGFARRLCLAVLCGFIMAAGNLMPAGVRAADPVSSVRLYAIDCGWAKVSDMKDFSDTGNLDGKAGELAVPCFLVWHPKGALLWDLGLGDKLADKKDGVTLDEFHLVVRRTLLSQLAAIGLKPGDIRFVAFSHMHWDHTGNANDYTSATWLINKREFDWATGTPAPDGVDQSTFSDYKKAKIETFDGDKDVFGDGSVHILRAPGHTPGHSVLLLKLKNAGTLILSGDLYHAMESRTEKLVPIYNTSRADTLASMDRIERLLATDNGRLVIQHAPESFNSLPKFPGYLD